MNVICNQMTIDKINTNFLGSYIVDCDAFYCKNSTIRFISKAKQKQYGLYKLRTLTN